MGRTRGKATQRKGGNDEQTILTTTVSMTTGNTDDDNTGVTYGWVLEQSQVALLHVLNFS